MILRLLPDIKLCPIILDESLMQTSTTTVSSLFPTHKLQTGLLPLSQQSYTFETFFCRWYNFSSLSSQALLLKDLSVIYQCSSHTNHPTSPISVTIFLELLLGSQCLLPHSMHVYVPLCPLLSLSISIYKRYSIKPECRLRNEILHKRLSQSRHASRYKILHTHPKPGQAQMQYVLIKL